MKFHKKVELWMNTWYHYSSEDRETEDYKDFQELKKIIEEMRKKNV